MTLKLEAKNESEKRVLEYLETNASEVLREKINAGNKTLKGFFRYASEEARRAAVNGCACIEDKVVYGWAVHYFEEDEIKEPAGAALDGTTAVKTEPKAESKAQAKPIAAKKEVSTVKPCKKGKAKDESQMSIFDMRGFKRYGV